MRNRPGSEPRRRVRAARLRPAFASIFAAACIAAGAAACAKASGPVLVLHPDSGPVRVRVELALTAQERSRGLMWRSEMDADAGMLFVFPDTKPRSFWMKNTRIPLDIAFISRDGTIVRIAQMQPFQETRTQSLYPATYALEMNLNWFESHDVQEGDKVTAIPTDVEVQ